MKTWTRGYSNMKNSKSYSEMIRLPTFEERFKYLQLNGSVAVETFGFDRWINQALYGSNEWAQVRRKVIVRDNGCDLAHPDYKISGKILVHHINPISLEEIVNRDLCVFDLDNLVSTTHITHNAIHYGNESLLPKGPIERYPNDTCPWKH